MLKLIKQVNPEITLHSLFSFILSLTIDFTDIGFTNLFIITIFDIFDLDKSPTKVSALIYLLEILNVHERTEILSKILETISTICPQYVKDLKETIRYISYYSVESAKSIAKSMSRFDPTYFSQVPSNDPLQSLITSFQQENKYKKSGSITHSKYTGIQESNQLYSKRTIPPKYKLRNSIDSKGRKMILTVFNDTELIMDGTSIYLSEMYYENSSGIKEVLDDSMLDSPEPCELEEESDDPSVIERSPRQRNSRMEFGFVERINWFQAFQCEMIKIKGTYFGWLEFSKKWIVFKSVTDNKTGELFIGSSLDYTQIKREKH